jgi:hypothetical protein
MQPMSAITAAPKTFNNLLSLERDFWKRQTGRFARVLKPAL